MDYLVLFVLSFLSSFLYVLCSDPYGFKRELEERSAREKESGE